MVLEGWEYQKTNESCKEEFTVKQLFYDDPLKICGYHCKLEDFSSGNILGEGRIVRTNSKRVKLKVKN